MESSKVYQYYNCWILRSGQLQKEELWIRNGKVVDPQVLFFEEKVTADHKIDCKNTILAPGFIEVQINGGFGYDFSTPLDTKKGVDAVAKGLLSQGVTSFCPTLVTSAPDIYKQIIPLIEKTRGSKKGAGVLGVHVEGPFISKNKKGAHPEHLIKDFDGGMKELEDTYGDLHNITLITLAPEKKQTKQVIEGLCNKGVTVSVGHSMANLEEGEAAVNSGAKFITHLFNAMLPFHHRDPHLVGLLTSDKLEKKSIYYGIIADGIHTHPAALRIAHRVNPKGLVLVTDAIQAMGLPAGTYLLGEHKVVIEGMQSVVEGTNTLAGSIATMDYCVRHFVKETNCGSVFALEAASLHPAEMLGIADQKGTLKFGADADFVMLDEELNVLATYIAGECVYKTDN